jgi:hypothetical protein
MVPFQLMRTVAAHVYLRAGFTHQGMPVVASYSLPKALRQRKAFHLAIPCEGAALTGAKGGAISQL